MKKTICLGGHFTVDHLGGGIREIVRLIQVL